ncbi:tetratricopeptide repeat protein, partial [Rhabdobacter roseus]
PWNRLGTLYEDHLARYQEAEAAYLKAIQLDENDILPKLNLLFMYRDKLNQLNKAKALFSEMKEPAEFIDSYWLNASLFALYDKNLGIATTHLLQALQITKGTLPATTQDDWWRYAAVTVRLGYGQAILDALQEHGYDLLLRPYYVAIQSLLVKDSNAFLDSIAVEIREVAADLAERIRRYM